MTSAGRRASAPFRTIVHSGDPAASALSPRAATDPTLTYQG
jgi:hypothetical protein